MKKMKWSVIGAMLCMAGLGFSINSHATTVTNTEGPVILYVTVYQQWDPSQPTYATNAAQVVEELYQFNSIAGAIDSTNRTLLVPYIAQFAGSITSKWLWASVHVIAKDPSYKFLPGECLTFVGSSTDGLLNKTNSFTDPVYYYDPASRGIIWGSSNHRASNQYASGYWTNTPVNEFISDGAASKYFNYTNAPGYTWVNLTNYILGYTSDYSVTLKWIYNDGTNNPVSASITLHTKQAAQGGTMTAQRVSDTNQVVLGLNGSVDDSWILQSAPVVAEFMTWSDEATMNAGDSFLRSTAPGQYYYRVRKQ